MATLFMIEKPLPTIVKSLALAIPFLLTRKEIFGSMEMKKFQQWKVLGEFGVMMDNH